MDDTTSERWLPVVGYEGLYEVSDLGCIKSQPRPRTRGGVLKQATAGYGVRTVTLTRDGKQRKRYVHHLVLEAFLGPCPEGLECCHGDGNPANNSLSNLRWDTHEANVRDMMRHGRGHWQNQTHCVNDHEFTAENTRLSVKGGRLCIACAKASQRKHSPRNKAQKRASYVPAAALDPDALERRRAAARIKMQRYRERKRAQALPVQSVRDHGVV